MKTRYQHIIWDWNGTLWNDTWLCTEINNRMLTQRGLAPITVDDYRAKLTFPVSDYYSSIGFDYEMDSYRSLAEEFIAHFERRRFECALQKGAREMIEDLYALKIPQAVLSAYHHDTLLQAVSRFELTSYFDEVIGLNDVYAAGKVQNGLAYIGRSAIDPSEILFIGDTLHDYEVAQAMGVDSILIANGHNNRARLEASESPVFDSLDLARAHIFNCL